MKNYLLDVCGDINDGDYVHHIEVISEKEVIKIKEMLNSIKKVREIYGESYPNSYKSWRDNLPYFSEVWSKIPYEFKYNPENLTEEDHYNWTLNVPKCDLDNFIEFYDKYCPNCIVDDDVHSINYIRIYELANDKYISLLND